ncbi:MAG: biotin--[acetyl-CoA-carboxylase] ligase, partial [Thermodesulfobacteriota bacterium]
FLWGLMKGRILKILKEKESVISGETIGSRLGISRVSVFKHIQNLREYGYEILSTPSGYRFIGEPDILLPWGFPGRVDQIHYFQKLPSTMDVARELARNNCPHFTVVIAETQTQGRGRLKRIWHSSKGGLFFTIVLRPDLPLTKSFQINLAASLILAKTLCSKFGIEARLKWPNDILINGKKVAGMLSEIQGEAESLTYINVGLGINVNNDISPLEDLAVSIKSLLGRSISRQKLLSEYLDALENRLNEGRFDRIITEWKALSATISKPVRIETLRETTKGIAEDIDEDGALILRLKNGSTKRILYGDCFHR